MRFNASSVERDNETIFTDMEIGVAERRGKMEKIRALEFVLTGTFPIEMALNIYRSEAVGQFHCESHEKIIYSII